MRTRSALLVLSIASLLAAGCDRGGSPPGPQPTPQPKAQGTQPAVAVDDGVEDGVPLAPEQSKAALPPAPRPAPTTRPPSPAASGAAKDMKALERQPGATPVLPQTTAAPGPKHKDLEGAPGPSPAIGKDDALVKVYVFSDFQCPVCRRVVEPMKELARTMGDDVQIIFKQNALEMHRLADGAARASLAAFRQGKFWEFHDKLFQDQRALSEPQLVDAARALGLDVERFQKDMADPAIAAQVLYERKLAEALGARGTPGFYINGKKMVGWGSYAGFKSMVERALKPAKALAEGGTPRAKVAVEATKASGDEGKRFAELVWGAK